MPYLAGCDRSALRSVLFQVLRKIEVVDEFIYTLQSKEQFWCDIDSDVDAFGHERELQTEFISEKAELLFLYILICLDYVCYS